jgi:hypothetical protein
LGLFNSYNDNYPNKLKQIHFIGSRCEQTNSLNAKKQIKGKRQKNNENQDRWQGGM